MYFGSRLHKKSFTLDRISLLSWFILLLLLLIAVRLFQVQVMDHQKYSTYAEQRLEGKVIPARRGRILLKDSRNGYFELANNVTLNLLFADPMLLEDPRSVAEQLAPLLFESVQNNHKSCGRDPDCFTSAIENTLLGEKRYREQKEFEKMAALDPAFLPPPSRKLSSDELKAEYVAELTHILSQKERTYVVLRYRIPDEVLPKIQEARLPGIYIEKTFVWANPLEIVEPRAHAEVLAPLLDMTLEELEFSLSKRPNRYVRILNRLDFETSQKIKDLELRGIGFEQEHWRNYTEQAGDPFAAQILGFLDHEGNSAYGLEKEWDDLLRGKAGIISGQVDLQGRTLTARSSSIEAAVDGSDLVLTLDHTVQDTLERLLREQVIASRAAGGQVIVQDPMTGKIIALVDYPTFNPNDFGGVYEKEEILLTLDEKASLEAVPGEDDHFYLYYNPGYRIDIFSDGERFLAYKNRSGVDVYRNSVISDIYEPGSVFKALVMAAALDAHEVKPTDTYADNSPLQVDCHDVEGEEVCDFTIKNSTNTYYGTVTMTQILEKSLNTGMAYIAKKMGKSLLHDYLQKFGIGEKTYIELPNESKGSLTHYLRWISESDMVTKAYGQGVAVTPLQVINAFSALVNGGILLQPSIISAVRHPDGTLESYPPNMVRRVITPETSEIIKAMLVSSIRRGVAQGGGVEGYLIGGKTGTSQIATRGVYEQGNGSTYATFAGFAPFENPRFTVLVKIDRPRDNIWGSTNAAPLFKNIMAFLLHYYQIPPDER